MQKSAKVRYTLFGMLLMFVISSTIIPAIAAVTYKQINVLYDGIKVVAHGKLIDQSVAGIPINPFMLGGITYIPARAIGEALCDGVTSWDESTKTLYLGPRPAPSTVTIKGVEYSTDSTALHFMVTPKTNPGEILTDDDTEPLTYFTKLEHLTLESGYITDISVLESLTSLTYLGLYCAVSDLSSLKSLTQLKTLIIGSSEPIRDFCFLDNMPHLESLGIGNNSLSELEFLKNMTGLKELSLPNNQISNIYPLSGLTNLTWLNLDTNHINDINPLWGLKNLTYLTLENNRISGLYALRDLLNLETLSISRNYIEDVTPLMGLTKLSNLCIGVNPVGEAQREELKAALPDCLIS